MDGTRCFELLSNHRRQYVFYALENTALTKSDLIDAVAELEYDYPDQQQRKRVHVSLVQNHLPKLKEYGAVAVENEHYHLTNTGERCLLYLKFKPESKLTSLLVR